MNYAASIVQRITPVWNMIHNYTNTMNGRIWIVWDENVYQVEDLTQGTQYLHCAVLSRDKKIDCCMTVVHGFNTIEQRRTLWSEVRNLTTNAINLGLYGETSTLFYKIKIDCMVPQ
uniref:Putative ovule protein n=1 Tax=Solanum chacoense TaxID=4108 RepID=A0A0V0HKN6_SOLCH